MTHPEITTRTAFREYLLSENKRGSNRATSYIRAIEVLDSILSRKAAAALDAESIWTLSDPKYVQRLYELVLEQQRLGQVGLFAGEEPVSYLLKMILSQYQNRCCVTGLDIPQLNIASHIIRWKNRKDTRLDPRNGLCLSATYDKAPRPEFAEGIENHLITFDEDYRLIVSKEIRDHYRNVHARELFEKRAGQVIHLPDNPKRRPLQEFLEAHRKKAAS